MDMNNFFDEDGLRAITSEWRDQHLEDGRQYGQVADVMQRRLEQQEIQGDGWRSSKRRARKVAKQVREMEKASRKAAAAAEALFATFKNEVVELPDRRAKALERKDQRRERLGIAASTAQAAVAKSLTNTTNTLTGAQPPTVGNTQVNGVQPAPQYVPPMPYQFPGQTAGQPQALPDFNDLFNQEAM